MSAPSAFEIHIHLTDGTVARYGQDDLAAAQAILAHIQPAKLFSQHHLLIAGTNAMTVYPCAAVARLDLAMHEYPGWPFHFNIFDIAEIPADEFKTRYQPAAIRQPPLPGEKVTAFTEIELVNRERIFFEVTALAEQRSPLDQHQFFQQLLSVPSWYARRREGGVILINPVHILRFTFYPGPPTLAPNAWLAHRLDV